MNVMNSMYLNIVHTKFKTLLISLKASGCYLIFLRDALINLEGN